MNRTPNSYGRHRRGGRNHQWSAPATATATWKGGGFKREPGNYPPVRTLADMSEDEIVAIEKRYGMPVIRPRAA